jgi:hypothetical protein
MGIAELLGRRRGGACPWSKAGTLALKIRVVVDAVVQPFSSPPCDAA